MVSTWSFPFVLYQQNILILGMQGSGKTSLANYLLTARVFRHAPRLIWSPQNPTTNYPGLGKPARNVRQLGRGAHVWVGDYTQPTFQAICRHLMTHVTNYVLVVDDAHEQVSKQKIDPAFSRLINSGRNRGITCVFITPYPNLITNQILQACRHRFCFRLDLESQVKWVANSIYGRDAWLLMPRDLRQKQPTQYADLDVLPDHSFLYRYDGDIRNQVIVGGIPVD